MKKDQTENKEITFEDSFLTSRRAVEILTILSESEEGNNASQIAREYDLDRSTVSRILKKLEARNLIEVSKRSQAKYFKPSHEGMAQQFLNLIDVEAESFLEIEGHFEAIPVMKEYYKDKLEFISSDKKRYPTLRDILLIAPAIDFEDYCFKNNIFLNDDEYELLYRSLYDSLEVGVDTEIFLNSFEERMRDNSS